MNVLSLFDGMSCGQIALGRTGIKIDNYFASEIKRSAIEVTKSNFPKTIHVGNVEKLKVSELPKIDLLIGGSPCQDFTVMKANRKNLDGEKSKLFYQYLRVLREIKPKYFLLENVRMNKDSDQQLNEYLGVDGIHINSRLFSYQSRPRIYWTNINFAKIVGKEINFQDFKESCPEICNAYAVKKTPSRIKMWNGGNGRGGLRNGCDNITDKTYIHCLTRKQDRSPNSGLIAHNDFCRYLTRRELEQAQTVPIGYTNCVSYNQAQDLLGDGWTIDVIAHIFNGIKNGKVLEYNQLDLFKGE